MGSESFAALSEMEKLLLNIVRVNVPLTYETIDNYFWIADIKWSNEKKFLEFYKRKFKMVNILFFTGVWPFFTTIEDYHLTFYELNLFIRSVNWGSINEDFSQITGLILTRYYEWYDISFLLV